MATSSGLTGSRALLDLTTPGTEFLPLSMEYHLYSDSGVTPWTNLYSETQKPRPLPQPPPTPTLYQLNKTG